MRNANLQVLLVGLVALIVPAARAQPEQDLETRFLRQQREIDRELEQQRLEDAPLESILDWQWGGWIEYYAFHFDDGVQRSRVVQRPAMSIWTRLRADDGAHEVFARVRLEYTYFNPGDEIRRQQDWEGPNFDRAWYAVDIGRALRMTEAGSPIQLRAKIGRQEVVFGTGYALDLPMDAAQVEARIHDFRVVGLVAKTIGSYPNIDRSEPVDSHSDRLFLGTQVSYTGWQNHEPFVYAFWNNDRTDERPEDWFQNYAYDTYYIGIGSRGELTNRLMYWAEGVFEGGRSYGNRQFLKQDYVQAWGWDLGLEYLFDTQTKPRLAFEYMYASGDGNRWGSPTNAAGGNRFGRKDTSFSAFGYRNTGISAAFIPSNLHIWRLSGSLLPLEQHEFFRDFEVGTDWFLYHKDEPEGAISDPTATVGSGYVGWEMDYYLNWRFASDLSWTARWGVFFPGKAYQDGSARHFFFTGLTWSF